MNSLKSMAKRGKISIAFGLRRHNLRREMGERVNESMIWKYAVVRLAWWFVLLSDDM